MALDSMLEEMIRSQVREQVASFRAMGATVDMISHGLAIALEEFAQAYNTVPADVLDGLTHALEDRADDRKLEAKRAAERKAAVPKITDSLFGLLSKNLKK